MAFPALPLLSIPGLTAGGGTCDYPSEDDVRDGVIYDFGAQTGNLELPSSADVLLGVGFGSNGTEFTGSLDCPQPPTPVSPSPQANPFAAIAYATLLRLATMTGLSPAYIFPVANARYKITCAEPMFMFVQFFTVGQPRDPGLSFTDAGAGNLARPVGRRMRVYVYTRSGEDVVGTDPVALFGANTAQTFATPPAFPGHFVAEEVAYNALSDWTPLSGTGEALTITPLHPLDASEEPERPPEDDAGLLRSCLDFEICYLMATDPSEPPS